MSTNISDEPGRPHLTCREVLDAIMSSLDGELDAVQQHDFDRHMKVCPSCVNYFTSYVESIRLSKAALGTGESQDAGAVPEELVRAIEEARRRIV